MIGIAFITGILIGGVLIATLDHIRWKGVCKKEKTESYNKGYAAGREVEKRSILDYIDLLANDPNACIYRDNSSEGSER